MNDIQDNFKIYLQQINSTSNHIPGRESVMVNKSPQFKSLHVFKRKENDSSIIISITPRKHVPGIVWCVWLFKSAQIVSENAMINLTTSEEINEDGYVIYKALVRKEHLTRSGDYYLAVEVVLPDEYKDSWYAGNVSMQYSLQVYESSCYYWDEGREEWTSYGCIVSIHFNSINITHT